MLGLVEGFFLFGGPLIAYVSAEKASQSFGFTSIDVS
jgi:hypothetical protein